METTILLFIAYILAVTLLVTVAKRKKWIERIRRKYMELAESIETYGLPYGTIESDKIPAYLSDAKIGEIYAMCHRSCDPEHTIDLVKRLMDIAGESDPDAFIVASLITVASILSIVKEVREG